MTTHFIKRKKEEFNWLWNCGIDGKPPVIGNLYNLKGTSVIYLGKCVTKVPDRWFAASHLRYTHYIHHPDHGPCILVCIPTSLHNLKDQTREAFRIFNWTYKKFLGCIHED